MVGKIKKFVEKFKWNEEGERLKFGGKDQKNYGKIKMNWYRRKVKKMVGKIKIGWLAKLKID